MKRKFLHSGGTGIATAFILACVFGTASAEEFPFDKELPQVGWQRDLGVGPAPRWLSPHWRTSSTSRNARPANWIDEAEFDEEDPIGQNPFGPSPTVSADWAEEDLDQPHFDPAPAPLQPFAGGEFVPQQPWACCHSHHWLPPGLLYKSYLAGPKEPRFATVWMHDRNLGWLWESTLGGRVGVYRYGTPGAIGAEGWQLDLEGAAMPRLDMDNSEDLEAIDFRFGVPLTYRRGPVAYKAGYYHISSHLGDEFMLRNPTFRRRNYVRDSLIAGVSYDVTCDVRTYAEVAYAFKASDGAEPWEFQFGAEYSPARAVKRGDPFFAVNAHLREEFDFGGAVNVVAGWQWRSPTTDRLARVGLQYYDGKSMQFEFFDQNERLLGFGIWFDY